MTTTTPDPDTAALLHGAVAILRQRAEAIWRQREQQRAERPARLTAVTPHE